jgi:hypothetical protein
MHSADCTAHAARFSTERFRAELAAYVADQWAQHRQRGR